MISWQPIKTAPKDKDVLIFINGIVIQAKYCQVTDEWEVESLPSHGCGCCGSDNEEPTHWAKINFPTTDPIYDSYKALEKELSENWLSISSKRKGSIGLLLEEASTILDGKNPTTHYLNGKKVLAKKFADKLRAILDKVKEIEKDL